MKVEMALYNRLVKEAPKHYENFDPAQVKEVVTYNELATTTGTLKDEFDQYKGKLDLWSDDAKTILQQNTDNARAEINKRIDMVTHENVFFCALLMTHKNI